MLRPAAGRRWLFKFLTAISGEIVMTALSWPRGSVAYCLFIDSQCGDPQLIKTAALEVAGAATRAAGRVENLGGMQNVMAKAATRAYETACDLLTARPATT